jgi:hypothetical protein
MTPSFIFTAGATSDISDRLMKEVSRQESRLDPSRSEKLRRVQERVIDLRSRGLLRRREIVVVTTSDFERCYMSQK